jgi:hypothetical protein
MKSIRALATLAIKGQGHIRLVSHKDFFQSVVMSKYESNPFTNNKGLANFRQNDILFKGQCHLKVN